MAAPTAMPARSTGKRIVLGVSGGIAAYKAVEVCRRLVDAGAHVVPVMTKGAEHFLGRTTLSALASEPVQTSLWDEAEPDPAHQARPERRPDPGRARRPRGCSARTRRPVDRSAHQHAARDARAGDRVPGDAHRDVGAPGGAAQHRRAASSAACTSSSRTRVDSPAATAARVASPHRRRSSPRPSGCSAQHDLAGLQVVVSAGGTREPIDAVRVIANRSSGKQGYAIAAEANARGAEVTLVTTVDLPDPAGVRGDARRDGRGDAGGDDERRRLRRRHRHGRGRRRLPAEASPRRGKIKKDGGVPEIVLEPTPDILAGLGASKRAGPDPRRVRRGDRRSARQRGGQAAPQEPRSDRRQRRQRTRRRLPARHQRRHADPRRRHHVTTSRSTDKRAIAQSRSG